MVCDPTKGKAKEKVHMGIKEAMEVNPEKPKRFYRGEERTLREQRKNAILTIEYFRWKISSGADCKGGEGTTQRSGSVPQVIDTKRPASIIRVVVRKEEGGKVQQEEQNESENRQKSLQLGKRNDRVSGGGNAGPAGTQTKKLKKVADTKSSGVPARRLMGKRKGGTTRGLGLRTKKRQEKGKRRHQSTRNKGRDRSRQAKRNTHPGKSQNRRIREEAAPAGRDKRGKGPESVHA